MASRYRRFIRKTLTPAELHCIADALNRAGYPTEVCTEVCTEVREQFSQNSPAQHNTTQPKVFLVSRALPLSIGTEQNLNWVETGQVEPLDSLVDELFLELSRDGGECTCSHCYAHWTDCSDLEGAWAPQPSRSCEQSEQRRRASLTDSRQKIPHQEELAV